MIKEKFKNVNQIKRKQNKNTIPEAYASKIVPFSAPPGARTLDTLIKSQVLYQLS